MATENHSSKISPAYIHSGPEQKRLQGGMKEECPNVGKSRQLQELWTNSIIVFRSKAMTQEGLSGTGLPRLKYISHQSKTALSHEVLPPKFLHACIAYTELLHKLHFLLTDLST